MFLSFSWPKQHGSIGCADNNSRPSVPRSPDVKEITLLTSSMLEKNGAGFQSESCPSGSIVDVVSLPHHKTQ